MNKQQYIPPIIEVFEFAVEHGYAQSAILTDEFIGDVSNEQVTEGDDYDIFENDIWY